jgi:hypothetical protein
MNKPPSTNTSWRSGMPYSASHAKMIAEVAAIAMKIREKSRNIVYPLMFSCRFLTFVRFEDSGAAKPLFSHPTYIIPQSYRLVKFLAGVFTQGFGGGFVMVSGAVLCYCVMGKGVFVTEDVTLKIVDSIE